MVKNRNDLLVSITDMLIDIGLDLSRIELYTKVFHIKRMVELTSMLYAAVVEFLQEIVEESRKNPVRASSQ